MIIRFLIFAIIIIVVCSVEMSHLSLDETTERLLYYDDENEMMSNISEESGTEESGEKSDSSVEEPEYDLSVDDGKSENEDFDEDFANIDEFVKEIQREGETE